MFESNSNDGHIEQISFTGEYDEQGRLDCIHLNEAYWPLLIAVEKDMLDQVRQMDDLVFGVDGDYLVIHTLEAWVTYHRTNTMKDPYSLRSLEVYRLDNMYRMSYENGKREVSRAKVRRGVEGA